MSYKSAIGKNNIDRLSSTDLSKWDDTSFDSFDKKGNSFIIGESDNISEICIINV